MKVNVIVRACVAFLKVELSGHFVDVIVAAAAERPRRPHNFRTNDSSSRAGRGRNGQVVRLQRDKGSLRQADSGR